MGFSKGEASSFYLKLKNTKNSFRVCIGISQKTSKYENNDLFKDE